MRARLRLHADDLNGRILLLEKARAAHNRAGGAHAADEVGQLAAGIAPNLRRGTFVMRQRIIGIGELVENNPPPRVAQLFRRVPRQLHAALFRRQHQLRAVHAHGLATLRALIFRHHQNDFVAAHRRHHRQRNAGITAGGLNQRIARLDVAPRLSPRNHRKRRPVLHRPRRIIPLQLGQQNVAAVTGNALQLHQRRVTDEIFQTLHAESL